MSIFGTRIASLCGALDSTAFADGAAVPAHLLRPIERTANRLLTKERALFNLWYPEILGSSEANQYLCEGVAPLHWVRVLPPITSFDMPGFSLADIFGRVLVSSTHDLEIYVATSQRPWRPGTVADVTVTGSGSFANFDIEDVPISGESEEPFELWIRGLPTQDLATTGTYGTPDERSDVAGSYTFITNDRLRLTLANWNTTVASPGSDLAIGGHYIQFEDSGGNVVAGARTIIEVSTSTDLWFYPDMSLSEQMVALAGDNFSIYKLPTYAFSQLGAVTVARTA